MANLKKYDLEGKEIGEVAIEDKLLSAKANMQMIKDYLVALKNNQRQWSANTKVRSEINRTKTKPHPQKGTGRARQGFLGAPQYKGGAIVFGPRPKFDQNVKINQKERRAAVYQLFAEKLREGSAIVLDCTGLETPKTKTVSQFLRNTGMESGRILFLGKLQEQGEEKEKTLSFAKSTRNIPKINFKYLSTINGYDLALNQKLVIMAPVVEDLIQLLREGAKQ
ncbi:MAG: 50S ribosomal protein L4 [Simkaniaceae bacterium]